MMQLRKLYPHSCILWVSGLVLLAASALKAYTLATGSAPERDFWSSRWFLTAIAEGELVIGLALLTSFYPRVVRLLALVLFAIFFEVNFYLALSGQKICPCFGQLPVPASLMAAFDLLLSVALFSYKPWQRSARTVHSDPFIFALSCMLIALLGIPAAVAMNQHKTGRVQPHLRREPKLQGWLILDAKNPKRQQILDRLSAATGLTMTIDKRLEDNEPSFGFVNVSGVPPWSLMEWLAQKQGESHWRKVEGGYELRPLPWWDKINPWTVAFWIFVAEAVGAMAFYGYKRRSAASPLPLSPEGARG